MSFIRVGSRLSIPHQSQNVRLRRRKKSPTRTKKAYPVIKRVYIHTRYIIGARLGDIMSVDSRELFGSLYIVEMRLNACLLQRERRVKFDTRHIFFSKNISKCGELELFFHRSPRRIKTKKREEFITPALTGDHNTFPYFY